MSLIVNRPYPIKICYLKDDHRGSEHQQQQKVSLTFLSSFIQQQKHAMKNNKQQNESPIHETFENSQFDESFQKKPKTTTYGAYQKWRKRKTQSQSEDKRLLTNLLGTDWANAITQKSTVLREKKKIKRTIQHRVETFNDDQRKQKNKRLMQNHFKTFLSAKKQKHSTFEVNEGNCFTTKMDARVLQSMKPSFGLSNFSGGVTNIYSRQKCNNSQNSETRFRQKLPSAIRNNKSSSIHSNLLRTGFKQIGDFKWSKLSNNDKFRLNE